MPKTGSERFSKVYISRQKNKKIKIYIYIYLSFFPSSSSLVLILICCFQLAPWHDNFLLHLEQIDQKLDINESKIWTLMWLKPCIFSMLQEWFLLGSNNINDIEKKLVFFFPQGYAPHNLADHIKEQVVLIHLDSVLLFRGKCL